MSKTKTKTAVAEPLRIAPDDPLADAHAAVSAWVEEAFGSQPGHNYQTEIDLKFLPTGQHLLGAKPDLLRCYVLAAAGQAGHWERHAAQIRATGGTTSVAWANPFHLPGWGQVWGRRGQATAVISTLMRRTLPFQEPDLLAILHWCQSGVDGLSKYHYPVGLIAKALERFAAASPPSHDLRAAMREFATRLRTSHDKDCQRFATGIERLCDAAGNPEGEPGLSATEPPTAAPVQPAPDPAPVGSVVVLDALKRKLGLPQNEPTTGAAIVLVGADHFPLRGDSPLQQEHAWLNDLFREIIQVHAHPAHARLTHLPLGKTLLSRDPATLGRAVLAAAERHTHALLTDGYAMFGTAFAASTTVRDLLQGGVTLDRAGRFDLMLYLSVRPPTELGEFRTAIRTLVDEAAAEATHTPLTAGERYVLWAYRAALLSSPVLGNPDESVRTLTRLIGDGMNFFLAAGEAWSDAANAELTRLDPGRNRAWAALLQHALSATSPRPSAKWLAAGAKLVTAIGGEEVQQHLTRWYPWIARGPTLRKLGHYPGDTRNSPEVMNDENANALRGLLWLVPALPSPGELTRTIAAVALTSYKKVSGVGPRAVKVGNAAVYALAELKSPEAVGQLALLKVRVKFGSAQKEIDKAFTTAAEALGLPRDQIEELGVPSYGLEEVGHRSETVGDFRAELVVSGTDAGLHWFDAKGKPLKSVPAAVKRDHKDDLKEWQEALKDVQAMLPAQRDRIDGLFLAQKSWPIADWLDRYGNHPLIGTIARRLIWRVDGAAVVFQDGTPTDVDGHPVEPGPAAQVTLWHPVECPTTEVAAWRSRLETLSVTQPFKQAHREVYLLTDAERNTRTYSNRFAAHVVRQHQFNALCGARGWKNQLRLMVDDSYAPPNKDLPGWGLRAEFWVEGIGDDYGTDTNESGVYLRLATDQVRFYRTGAAANSVHASGGPYESTATGPGADHINEPIPLDQVPPLVLSEVMRDIDLFVGVASVGNDPTWQDGGPEGRYQAYWQDYAFGELSGTASTRKTVLERLVPRLKIAGRCSIEERFLKVRGDVRTYKIHLGSGNILMEPKNQYLCIVPDTRAKSDAGTVFLPFEGDNLLSIILSKAFLLADDTKIKDPTILTQIHHR